MSTPPRLATWVLSRRLAAEDRDEILGDLAEDFADRAATDGRGRATTWYWRQALRPGWGRPWPRHGGRVARAWSGRPLSIDDLRYALRRLARQPAASLMCVLTLACAIGVAVATWSLLSAVLLHPLPVRDPDRLVVVGTRGRAPLVGPSGVRSGPPLSLEHLYPLYSAVRDSGIFEEVAASGAWTGKATTTMDGAPAESSLYFVSSGFFETLGLQPAIGRAILGSDDRRGATPVAMLSYRFWQQRFGGQADAVGTRVRVEDHTVTIVGVAPEGFRGIDLSEAPDLYLPLETVGDVLGDEVNWFAEVNPQLSPTAWVRVVGRLRPGMTIPQALGRLAALNALGPGFARTPVIPQSTLDLVGIETSALAGGARPDMVRFIRLLGATVGLLVLIGCLAVGMLLLVRTEARRDELAMCLALGATRVRLAFGIVAEGAALSATAALLAIPLSSWLLSGIRGFRLPGDIDVKLLEIPLDWRTFTAAVGAAAFATVVMAVLATAFGFSSDVSEVLRTGSGGTPRTGRRRARAMLVVGEVAIALVLVSGAALLARSLREALSLNPGYDTAHIVMTALSLPAGEAPERASQFFIDLEDRLDRLPAIQAAATDRWGYGMSGGGTLIIDGEPRGVPSFVPFDIIDEHYLPTIGLTVIHGRNFTADDRPKSPPVAIVSASLGRFVAGGGDPLGHRIRDVSGRPGQPFSQIDIVGVVPDIITNVRVLQPLVLYRPVTQAGPMPRRDVVLHARDTSVAVREALSTIHQMEPTIQLPEFTTIDDELTRQMGPQVLGATVIGSLGAIAVALTLFGVFVLVESTSVARRREMGVRAALGATRPALTRLMLVETIRLCGAGVLVGLLLVWLGSDFIRAFLFQVGTFDVPTIAVAVTGMFALAIGVSLRPALRAGRFDVARVLREN